MFIEGVKPRTHLKIDILLFALLVTVAFSALMEHTVIQEETHARFMFHAIHGVAGIAMCLTISLHLLIHLPWIRSQLRRLFARRI
jgi:flagellar biosynthesis protein FliQ